MAEPEICKGTLIETFNCLFKKAKSDAVMKDVKNPTAHQYKNEKELKKAMRAMADTIDRKLTSKKEEPSNDVFELLSYVVAKTSASASAFECKPPLESTGIRFDQIAGLHKTKLDLEVNYIYPFSFPGLFPSVAKGILLYGPPGGGKCLGPEEKVVMFDGTLKMAKDIVEGDVLMGDDSTPRNVLSTCTGEDEMFRIVPTKGEPFVVNKPHILSLVTTKKARACPVAGEDRIRVMWFEQGEYKSKGFSPKTPEKLEEAKKFAATIPVDKIDVPLDEYMKKAKYWKACYKGYRVGADWPAQPVPLDPYVLGAWLGDGTSRQTQITNTDDEVINGLGIIFKGMGLKMTPKKHDPITYYIGKDGSTETNAFLDALRELNLIQNKHIPLVYKANDRATRLQVLAGLLDTDGYLNEASNYYEIIQKNKTLADDIVFLARSLGYYASCAECTKVCTNAPGGPKPGQYHRMSICGENLDEIPVKMARKTAKARCQIKDAAHFGFKVEPLGVGQYCGFTLDGNSRFLLKDFTVTHNTLLASAATEELKRAAYFAPSPGDLKGKYEGETEKNIANVFECANQILEDESSRYDFSVIFLDEVDSLGGQRGDDPGMTRSVNALLQAMDGVKKTPNVSVLAATNFPWMLDGAFLRRFTARIFVDLPDEPARQYLVRSALAIAYSDPKMSDSQKRNSIWNGKDFYSDAKYIKNIKAWGGDVDDKYINAVVERLGPNSEGKKIIASIRTVQDTDSRLKVAEHIFGYSPSDITKLVEYAIKRAATRALHGTAGGILGGMVTTDIEYPGYFITVPNSPTTIKSLDPNQKSKVINFVIMKEDIEDAMKNMISTVDNYDYVKLLKYSLSA